MCVRERVCVCERESVCVCAHAGHACRGLHECVMQVESCCLASQLRFKLLVHCSAVSACGV